MKRWMLGGNAGLILLAALVGGCSVGDVEVGDGQSRSKDIVLSVGNVDIGRGCRLRGDIRLQAGNVSIGEGTEMIGGVDVKHGNVALGRGVHVRTVTVDNGSIELQDDSVVEGLVRLNQGLLDVQGGTVEGRVELMRGRLQIASGSELTGGLRVENLDPIFQDTTFVVISPGARVAGEIHVEGVARLIVHPGSDTADAVFTGGIEPEGP
jgi:hypothetical protein